MLTIQDANIENYKDAYYDALRYARNLAEGIHKKHWKTDSPSFQVENELHAVLMQIDNMTVGLKRVC